MKTIIRAFIAIPLSPLIQTNLAEFIHRYGLDSRSSGFKAVKPAQIHITLKFFREIPLAQIEPVSRKLQQNLAGLNPFRIHVHGLGAFPAWQPHPRVIWVGLDPLESIQSLFEKIDAATVSLGFPSETRQFSPHLTLARAMNSSSQSTREGLIQRLASLSQEPDFGNMTVDRVNFYQSELFPEGPKYTLLSSHVFSGTTDLC
ncbi:MAG TPA: RNA 2',3'-cyclic phosphodiesterase [Anaerolineaceae bacterium]|nr:RNA 2',3'-cyclic phosphodiesterase [Anaerolineaceae bacterium]HOV05995.1 RNA 2',3'-cyclic phosphodiesterase [Anaerolineaceae bacterium]